MGGTTRAPKSLTPPRLRAQAADDRIWYHGTPDERSWEHGAAYGIHVGTEEAARQALNARIGRPAKGEWDGTREYGKTLLNRDYTIWHLDGTSTTQHHPPTYPTRGPVYSSGHEGPLDARPSIFPVRIKGPMVNRPSAPVTDDYANSRMRGQITRGTARRGYYYVNHGEDEGSVSAAVPSAAHLERVHPPKEAARWQPSSGIFGPTTGLDPLLFDEAGKLRPDVPHEIMTRLDQCIRVDSGLAGSEWQDWTRVYITGGSASEWAGDRPNEKARDLDVIVAIDVAEAHGCSAFEGMNGGEAASALNAAFWKRFNTDGWKPGFGGTWNLTAFCNQRAWDIAVIKPYAAYDLTGGRWAVKPPHLPEHSLADFDPAVIAHARAVAAEARAVLRMPEPLRTREARDLWEHIHAHRCVAFSGEGTGWDDPGNIDEKMLAYAPRHLLDQVKELALAPKTAAWDFSGSDHSGVYLRFGDWPHDERSFSPAGGYHEDGVSVYDLDREGDPSIDHGFNRGHEHDEHCDENCYLHEDNPGNDPREEMQGRRTRAERARHYGSDEQSGVGHLVRGEMTGVGYDGEPLLKNVKRVGDWIDHRHLFLDQAGPHRLARDPSDEDYEEPEEKPPYGYRNRTAALKEHNYEESYEEDPDRYVTCDQGHEHWGALGAAGLLVRHDGKYLLQKRSPYVQHGSTWSTPGGALQHGETPEEGAVREAGEEGMRLPAGTRHSHTFTDDHGGGWAYHTVVMDAPHEFHPGGEENWESEGHGWFSPDEMRKLPLHPGFAASWDKVRKSAAVEKTADASHLAPWMQWTAAEPHKAVIFRAQHSLREEHPELTEPLDHRDPDDLAFMRNRDSETGSAALQEILRAAGHPKAETAWVAPHPDPKNVSQVAVDDKGNLGAVLLLSRWDLGTVAHEAAHLVHAHQTGIDLAAMARGEHEGSEIGTGVPDHVMHGPEFSRHLANALDVLSPGAGDGFLRHRQNAVGLIGNVRARFHKLPKEFEGGEPIRREAAADSRKFMSAEELGSMISQYKDPGTGRPLTMEEAYRRPDVRFNTASDREALRTGYRDGRERHDALRAHIRENGIQNSIFYDSGRREVDGGHHRYFAGRDEGLTHFPVNAHDRREKWQEVEGFDTPRPRETGAEDYRQPHRGPDADDGEALHELGSKGFFPPDVYDRPHYYGGDPAAWQKMRDAKGDPDRRVMMYRAMPAPHHKINPGDWVSLSKDYALEHAQEQRGDHYAVLKSRVRAGDLRNDGNDLHEWTYHGPVLHYPGLEHRGEGANGWKNKAELSRAQVADAPQEDKDRVAEMDRQDQAVDRSRRRDESAAMVYLHVPPGTLHAPQGGEPHHHVTLAYLPKNMSDEDFDRISGHVRDTAARHAPFKGTFGGHGTFPEGADSLQKRTAYVPLHAPGAHSLHADLGHLSRSRYENFAPHATLAYLRPGDSNPEPHPEVSVPFTHVHVRRGDEVRSYPLTGPSRMEHEAAGQVKPLPVEEGLYYRTHHRDAPFDREHAFTKNIGEPASPEMAKYWEPKPGYSAFWNPHHLDQYHREMNWDDPAEMKGRRVLMFRGTPVGSGADGEPAVMPHSDKPEASMSWGQFRKRLEITTEPATRWDDHTWGQGPNGQMVDDGYRTIHQAATGYTGLKPRSGMIYLDLPPGTVRQVPGGVDDHHVTIVYLGSDVSDEAFAEACRRTEAAAAKLAPMSGVLRGIDIFPPSGSSKGKIPAFVPAYVGSVGLLRRELEDLSASEHKDWRPHVTLAYMEEGDSLPAPHPAVPLHFTHVHVKRGDDVRSFPLGGGIQREASAEDLVDVYHHTTPESAHEIWDQKHFEPFDEFNRVYGTNLPPGVEGATGADYGGSAVHLRVPRSIVHQWPGRTDESEHYYDIDADDIRPEHFTGVLGSG
jgi:2'-5' RNA ligase/ADP-ribose pyrophosphatase YjhB (NUDIX family)